MSIMRGRLLARTMLTGAAGPLLIAAGIVALPSVASAQEVVQTAAAAPAPEEVRETIVVTGTRITTPGASSNSPITSVAEAEIGYQQPVAIEQLIKDLPSAVPAIGPGTNNGSNGGATVDLRGLGTNRNVILMNGRRVVPFTLGGTVDTNVIPVALLERIDLVTGGASAVYGADAVTGVVNFIMKNDFEGLDLSASTGFSGENDGERSRIDLTMGAGFDDGRGHAVMSLGYTSTEAIRQDARPFGLETLSSTTGAAVGSGTAVPGRFGTTTAPGGTSLGGTLQIDPATGALVPTYSTYNFNPDNFYQTPLDRYQLTAMANYQVNEWIETYAEALYVRSAVDTQLASSGTFLNVFQVPIGNPYIPEPARQQLCAARNIAAVNCVAGNTTEIPLTIGRRITEWGPRLNDFETKTLQYTVGVRGPLPIENWDYDVYYTYGESDQIQIRGNWGSLSKVQQALRAVNTTSCLSTANGCVPLNVFGAEGSITPAMAAFTNLSAILGSSVDMEVLSASVAGDLGPIKSPLSADPIGVAGGYEYRRVSGSTLSDSASQIQGEVLGTGAPLPNRSGAFQLKEFYAEALVPVITDMPFAERVALELGVRQTSFASANEEEYTSYKAGLEWAPIDGLRFRGMLQRATRAPSVNELFAPQVTGLSNLAVDPCQGTSTNQADANTAGTLSNLCRLTGVPASELGVLAAPSAGQINQLTGGNPNLGPEEADTTTIGVVFQPAFVDGLSITLDYYDIELTQAITSPSSADILNGCYSTALNPGLVFNTSCSLIGRNPANGSFNGVDAKGVVRALGNLGVIQTDGFDLGITYSLGLDTFGLDQFGSLDFSFNGTKVNSLNTQPTPASVVRECTGYYSIACGETFGGVNFEYKWNLRSTWNMDAVDVSLNWRHLDSVIEEPGGTNFLPAYAEIDAFDYFDLSAVWDVTDNLMLNATVTNVFDEQPPVVGNDIGTTSANSGNTFPQYYDAVGRYFMFGAKVRY